MKRTIKDHKTMRTLFCCPLCGGLNVSIRAWVDANTMDGAVECDDEPAYCADCDEEVRLAEKKVTEDVWYDKFYNRI